jgi:ribonucleoside-triphosphate reductase
LYGTKDGMTGEVVQFDVLRRGKLKMTLPKVYKKNGQVEDWNDDKIIKAVSKSFSREGVELGKEATEFLLFCVHEDMLCSDNKRIVTVEEIHNCVERGLLGINEEVAHSYGSYRDYKRRYNKSFENIKDSSKHIVFAGSKENANKDSQLISTKKELISGELAKELYLEYELPPHISQAHKDGDFYIHDTRDRILGAINCCLFDMATVLKGGFNLNGVQYTEPTSAESALRVLSDVILQASSQQYGGFTVPEIDTTLAPYVEKAIIASEHYYRKKLPVVVTTEYIQELAHEYVERALEQGLQACETRLNTINNSNGQTAFITFTFGLETSRGGRLVNKILIENRKNGIGKNHLTPVFPKLVFLHRYGVNGQEGDPNYDLYLECLRCSLVRIYPDYLSLNAGYLGDIYDKYKKAISPMGCRAYLSPWFKRGGAKPADENDEPVFIGRANCGAVTLNTVRYAIEAKGDMDKYFEIFYDNFQKAREVHKIAFESIRKMKASSNPLFFCEGGCHVRLNPEDTIEEAIKTFTWSFGYIGLTEASYLMTGKAIHEDNSFAIKVLKFLDNLVEKAKEEDGLLYAIYGTPAESLCKTFRDLDYKKYGKIEGATDRAYYMNSFHVDVKAEINPIRKQRIEDPMFQLSKGGRITYNEFPNTKNFTAVKQMVDNAMNEGKYFGVNVELDSCNDCGAQGEFKDYVCTKCGSHNITMIDRVCGYVSYRKLNGDTRYNDGKFAEVEDRVDHQQIPVEIEGLASVLDFDFLNGEGARVSIWVDGCPHHCRGCHNKALWKHTYSKLPEESIDKLITLLDTDYHKSLSVLGGEPLAPYNIDKVTYICKRVKEAYPDRTIWLWTGYLYEKVKDLEVMQYIDTLIDGEYVEELKDEDLLWCGSSNQRIINVKSERA